MQAFFPPALVRKNISTLPEKYTGLKTKQDWLQVLLACYASFSC